MARDIPHRAEHRAWTYDDDARFFDAIADGATITAAAQLVGRTRNAGIGRFNRVVKAFGWQAA